MRTPEINPEVEKGIAIMHANADEQNDMADHDECHAAGAVMYYMATGVLTEKDKDYIFKWLYNLNDRVHKL